MTTMQATHSGGIRFCTTVAHWRADGTHRPGGAGHRWEDVDVLVGARFTFDETQPNGAAILALCYDNDMVEVT